MAEGSHHMVDAAGVPLHFRLDGSGPPLLLLHSNGASSSEFDGTVDRLAGLASVFRLDLPGFGDTPAMLDAFAIGPVADAVAHFAAVLDVGPMIVVGTSLGGTIAADLASRHPHLVRAVGLVETPCRSDEQWARAWPIVERIFGQPTQTLSDIEPRFQEATPQLLVRWNHDREKAGAGLMMEAMWAIRRHDVIASVRRIDQDCLLLFGADGAVGDGAEALVGAVKRPTRVILEGCGHFPMIDDPAAFADAVVGWLEGVGI